VWKLMRAIWTARSRRSQEDRCRFEIDPARQRVVRIKDVGPKTGTAMVAAVGNGAGFKNGRHLAAWLELAPRQHTSADKRE
jgi:transposase